MKTILFSIFIISGMSFAQTDLSKKQAFEAFKISEARKELNIKLSQFSIIYKQAKCLSKAYQIKVSQMPIFLKELPKDTFIDKGRFRQSIFGLGDTIFPSKTDDGKKTITCGAFETNN